MAEAEKPFKGTMANEWRIMVPLTKAEHEHIHQVARRNCTAVSTIGRIAILNLLIADNKGEFSVVPEFLPGADIHHA